MIEITKLIFRGFMPYKDRQEVPLSNQGLVRVEGKNLDEGDSNRAGKTAIIEPLVWVFFKKTIRLVKHESIIHRFQKKRGCYGEVQFTSNGVAYRIARYQGHRKYANRVRLWVHNRERSFRHADETQRRIESILGCDYISFVNSVIFGGGRPFAALSDSEQKKVLESFLHFERLDEALRYTKKKIEEIKESFDESQNLCSSLRGEVDSLRESLRALRNSERKWVSQRSETIRALQKHLSVLESLKLEKPSRKSLARAQHRLEKAAEHVSEKESQYLYLREKVRGLERKLGDRKKLLAKPNCPTCGQSVKKHSLESVLKHYSHELKELQERRSKMHRRLLHLQKEENEARQLVTRAQNKNASLQSKIDSHVQQRRDAKIQLDAARGATTCETLEQTPFAADINKLSIRYSRTFSKLTKAQLQAQTLQSKLRDLEFWVTGFGNQGVKALIVRRALPAMNAKLKEFAQEIFDGKAEIEFKPSKETKAGANRELFNLSYRAKFGSESYLGESAGGRKRIDICVLLVFSWLSRTCNLLLVDELLDGLDKAGQESVLSILSKLRGTVLVISHNRDLKAKMGQVWTVVKKNGRSTLEIPSVSS